LGTWASWRIRGSSSGAVPGRQLRLSSKCMAGSTSNIAKAKGRPKPAKAVDATEIAARYFVYKLFDATAGQPMRWVTLRRMNESRATIARAIERGWVILDGTSGKPLELKAALTDEGRRLARKGR
jgi:hypothetical protein